MQKPRCGENTTSPDNLSLKILSDDHKVHNVESESRFGHRSALVVQSIPLDGLSSPMTSKEAKETMACLQHFEEVSLKRVPS